MFQPLMTVCWTANSLKSYLPTLHVKVYIRIYDAPSLLFSFLIFFSFLSFFFFIVSKQMLYIERHVFFMSVCNLTVILSKLFSISVLLFQQAVYSLQDDLNSSSRSWLKLKMVVLLNSYLSLNTKEEKGVEVVVLSERGETVNGSHLRGASS